MSKAIPIIMCLDVEPDDNVLDPQNPLPWKGFERSFEFFSSIRSEISSSTGSPAHFSWFLRMDPQVAQVYGSATWSTDRYPNFIEDIRNQGDELGLHVHFPRWDQSLNNWVIDHGNPQWVEHCILSSLAAFYQALGKKCISFRFGGCWISNEAVSLLEKSGVCFELTLEPGGEALPCLRKNQICSGFIPNWIDVPQEPYIPLASNYKMPDPNRREGIWMIPVSRGRVFGLSALALKIFRRLAYGFRSKTAWATLLLLQDPRLFRQVVDDHLRSMSHPYLVLVARSDAPLRPYFLRNMKKNLNYILSHPRVKDFVFSTPREAMTSLGLLPLNSSTVSNYNRHAV